MDIEYYTRYFNSLTFMYLLNPILLTKNLKDIPVNITLPKISVNYGSLSAELFSWILMIVSVVFRLIKNVDDLKNGNASFTFIAINITGLSILGFLVR